MTDQPTESELKPCNWQLADLRAANIERQEEWCPDEKPDLSFRGNELAGEAGEACNVIKKLERERHGWRGSRASLSALAEELADVVICADLCALVEGIDLQRAVQYKFDATSEKNGLATRLTRPAETELQSLRSEVERLREERDGATAQRDEYLRAIEYAQHGSSGMCCSLREHVTKERDTLKSQNAELVKALEKIKEATEEAYTGAANCAWIIATRTLAKTGGAK